MRKAENILDEELSKVKTDSFIKFFYKINREKIVSIIKDIQLDAIDAALKKSCRSDHDRKVYKNKIKEAYDI